MMGELVKEACGMAKPTDVRAASSAGQPADVSDTHDSHPGGFAMTAFRFARVALPSVALSVGALLLPQTAAARGLEDEWDAYAQEGPGPDTGPATRRMDERRRANEGDWFRVPVLQGPIDFPAAQIQDLVEANARAATARQMYRRVESALNAGVRSAVRDFEQSAQLKEAMAAEQRAYDALQDARREALRDVVANPKYQAMQDLRDTLTQKIADRRDGVDAPPLPRLVSTTTPTTEPVNSRLRVRDETEAANNIAALATVKLRVGTDARGMERDALAGNDKVKQARADLATASAKVTALRDQFDRQLRDNPDLKRVREDLEDARIARVTAETYLLGADLAAEFALDFSYYLHRWDYNRYGRYYDYGYGYPYYYRVNYYGYHR
jgi:hypothetical protein